MNEKTLLPGNRECSHKFRTMPIKHPRCGQFVTPIKDVICYPLNIKYISQCIENLHQYIFQNNLHDTSTHGLLFKAFMSNINKAFPGELDIQICSESPIVRGAGEKIYKILAVKFTDRYLFCNIRPSRIDYFTSLVERMGWKYLWGESDDLYFDRLNRCTKRLQGYTVKPDNMAAFVAKYRIRLVKSENL